MPLVLLGDLQSLSVSAAPSRGQVLTRRTDLRLLNSGEGVWVLWTLVVCIAIGVLSIIIDALLSVWGRTDLLGFMGQ